MELDKRIEDYHDIKCFASRNNRECLGKFGYFADSISEFANLDNCAKGICHFQDGENFPFYRIDNTSEKPMEAYPIFYPFLSTMASDALYMTHLLLDNQIKDNAENIDLKETQE